MSAPEPDLTQMATRRFLGALALGAGVGVAAALAAWCFLELTHQIQVLAFTKLPGWLGYDHAPAWWPAPVAVVGGLVVAWAIVRLPGRGGHPPAHGLSGGTVLPGELPGVIAAGLGTIGLGLVLGPEAPLIALGGGLGLFAVRLLRRDAPPELGTLLAACGTFSALALIFASPVIAAVILIEVTGLGGARLKLVMVPGLLAAAIGSLVSLGLGSFTGLSTSAYALAPLSLPAFARPTVVDFLWTVPFAAALAIGCFAVFRLARRIEPVAVRRPFLALPVAGLGVAGLAILFDEVTGKGAQEVLFSGQEQLPGLIGAAGAWSLGTLALMIACKAVAWALSLAAFRGGPTFPAVFLGAAGGLLAARLPGFGVTPAVAVGLGAGVAAVLRLPLSAVVLALLLTAGAGAGSAPLVIAGVVTAYLTTLALDAPQRVSGYHPDGVMAPERRASTVKA